LLVKVGEPDGIELEEEFVGVIGDEVGFIELV
jgi:hypothetical protein